MGHPEAESPQHSAASLAPAFQVLGPGGEMVATGTVNGAPLDLPEGDYSLRVAGTSLELVPGVRVRSAQLSRWELKR